MENRVYRCIEDKARGFWPFTGPEFLFGAGLFVLGLGVHLFVGMALFVVGTGTLVAWRRFDHDRSDYASTWLRRRFRRSRSASPATPDVAHRPFPYEGLGPEGRR